MVDPGNGTPREAGGAATGETAPSRDTAARLALFRHRDPFAALGSAALFVSQAEPFSTYPFGPWMDTIKGQILRNHYVFSQSDGRIVGYCGWALTDHAAAEDWAHGRRTLSFDECRDGPCVVVMAARALTPRVQAFHTHVMRALHWDREVAYWQRQTPAGARLVRVDLQASGVRRKPPDFDIPWIGATGGGGQPPG